MNFCFHKYGKWIDDNEVLTKREGRIVAKHLIQVKICSKCNKKKIRSEKIFGYEELIG